MFIPQPDKRVMAMLQLWKTVVVLTLGAVGANSQANFAIEEPTVHTLPMNNPTNNEYFGYSAVLHQLSDPPDRATSLTDTRIIVSAPNATAQGSPVDFTGVLYMCFVNQSGCEPFDAFDRFYDIEGNQASEIKTGQFLGVAMDSRGGNFVACAHRHINTGGGGSRSPFGRCYLTTNRALDSGFVTYEPCVGESRGTGAYGNCEAGTSAVWALNNDESTYTLGIGAPGTYSFAGILIRREQNGDEQETEEDEGTLPNYWMGYAMTSGRINPSSSREDFVTSAPRGNTYNGYVNIVRNLDNVNVLSQEVTGSQTGEYFGFSLLTADLNGDGLDDLLVGAPMYSLPGQPEIGRVFVYNNVAGSLVEVRTIVGDVPYGRFSYAMANLGDINGDGLDDVAISAPFGVDVNGMSLSGTVFIYRGSVQNMLNMNPVQEIIGSVLTNSLSGVNTPVAFGTSLASGVDVDMNQYNDLVIGAWDSQQVFLLRTRPVAVATVTFTSTPTIIDIDAPDCNRDGITLSCFTVRVCVSYTGTGISSTGIDFMVQLDAESQFVADGLQSRLFFNSSCPVASFPIGSVDGCPNTLSLSIDGVPVGTQDCIMETVYVKPDIQDIFNPLQVEMSLSGPEFTTTQIDGNPDPSNLEEFPVIQASGPSSLQVVIQNECAGGNICYPDLGIAVTSVTFGTTTGELTNTFIGGLVRTVNMELTISNTGDDAFGVNLMIALPGAELTYDRISSTLGVSCSVVPSDMAGEVRSCPVRNRQGPNENVVLNLMLSADRFITENTPDVTLGFNVSTLNPENETDLDNNDRTYTFSFAGLADIFLDQPIADPESVTYMNITPPSPVVNVIDLGPPVRVTFVVRNAGPTMTDIDLRIFWPLMAADQGDSSAYYFYPFAFTREADVSVTCVPDPMFNPDNLMMPMIEIDTGGSTDEGATSGNKRRKRRTMAHIISRRQRRKRQAEQATDNEGGQSMPMEVQDLTIDCTSSDECYQIPCSILSLPANQSASVTIIGYLDERYFGPRVDRFTFIISGNITTDTPQPADDRTDMQQVQVRVLPIEPQVAQGEPVPVWVIIVPIILGVLAIVTLGVILYLVGFFKRKHKQKKEEIAAQYLGDPDDAGPPTNVAT